MKSEMENKSNIGVEASTNHVEEVDDMEANAEVHFKTYLLVLAVNMVYVAQLVTVVASGALARNIVAVTGGSSNTVWFPSIITIVTACLTPPICQMADYWGRKGPLVYLTLFGCVGSIILSRANSSGTVLAGFFVSALAYGSQALVPVISSEVLPRRLRSYAQGFVNLSGCVSALVFLMIGGALTRNGQNEHFRIYFYICAGVYLFAAILCFVAYNPAPRELQVQFTFYQKLQKLDWPAYLLLTSGIVLFCIGLSWSQNPYPWSDPRVAAPFAIGVALLIGLILYCWLIKKDGMIHHQLFRHRNFPIALGCLMVEGLSFFCINTYIPYETSVLFTSDPLMVAVHLGVAYISAIIFSALGGAYSWYTKTTRPPAMTAYVFFMLSGILLATITTSTPEANFYAYPIFGGAAVGLCLSSLMTTAQFATPLELISTTTGLVLCIRNLGSAIGLAVYNAILNHTVTVNFANNVAAGVLPLGLPQSSLAALLAALAAEDEQALAAVPGITDKIMAAAEGGVRETYVLGFRYVWVTAASFGAAAAIATIFIYDPKKDFNSHVDAPVVADITHHLATDHLATERERELVEA